MKDNSLQSIEDRRTIVNRRIGIYSLWVILVGVGLALLFFGGRVSPERRWGIFALVVVYVAIRFAIMRYRARRQDAEKSEEE